jgi:hypothetical protein
MLYWAGYRGEPIGGPLWAVIILAAGVAIAATMLWREADWAYALVLVWAYIGIAAGQSDTIAVMAALAGAMVVVLMIVYAVIRPRLRGLPATRAGT